MGSVKKTAVLVPLPDGTTDPPKAVSPGDLRLLAGGGCRDVWNRRFPLAAEPSEKPHRDQGQWIVEPDHNLRAVPDKVPDFAVMAVDDPLFASGKTMDGIGKLLAPQGASRAVPANFIEFVKR